MIITLGTKINQTQVNVDPRIKGWYIYCVPKPSLHLEFELSDFGTYEDVVSYAKILSKELNGVFVNVSVDHMFIVLEELEDKGQFISI